MINSVTKLLFTKKSKLVILFILSTVVSALPSSQISAQTITKATEALDAKITDWKPDAGYRSLFDGKTLNGWCYRDKAGEVTEDFNGKTSSADGRYSAANGILTVNYPVGIERKVQESWTLQEFPRNFILKIEFRASKNADSGIFLRKRQLQCRDYLVAGPYKDLKKYVPQDWNTIIVTVKDNIAHCECNGEVLEDALVLPATGPLGLEGDRGQMEYRHIQIKELP